MICVGIDVSKRKSTVCFMAPGDKIICRLTLIIEYFPRNGSTIVLKMVALFGFAKS